MPLRIAAGQHSDKGRKAANQDFHGLVVPGGPQLATKGIAIALADGRQSLSFSGLHEAVQRTAQALAQARAPRTVFLDEQRSTLDQVVQFLGIVAAAINDSNAAAVAVYNSFSPATAQGNGLSSVVKINGITRLVASNSTVDLTVVGIAGTTITNGQASDSSGSSSSSSTTARPTTQWRSHAVSASSTS